MNALAECFGFVSNPWIDLDVDVFNINYFHPPTLKRVLMLLVENRVAGTIKSHHEFEFFAPFLHELAGELDVVYIHRHPADTLRSFWKFLPTWHWTEGPAADTALDFVRAAPMGRLLRYQYRQHETMLDRWAAHVGPWVAAAAALPNVHAIRFEDLDRDYEATIRGIAEALGLEPQGFNRPARGVNEVTVGDIRFEPEPGADNREAVVELAQARYGELMAELGYAP